MLNVVIWWLIGGLEMAIFEPKNVFLGLLDTLCMFICAKVVYSDSAQGELSFGTKTGSLGPCVLIL